MAIVKQLDRRAGKNKDHEPLAQINFVLVFGQDSNLPFYYRKLAGNIPDVKTVKELVKELDVIECFQQPGKDPFIGEILSRQNHLYLDLGVTPPENPTSLC